MQTGTVAPLIATHYNCHDDSSGGAASVCLRRGARQHSPQPSGTKLRSPVPVDVPCCVGADFACFLGPDLAESIIHQMAPESSSTLCENRAAGTSTSQGAQTLHLPRAPARRARTLPLGDLRTGGAWAGALKAKR